ncbi:outer membrane protein [unidentified eubacterium SCB49]|nr:outer membrane protein [unidentified eubacterium SCB49]
MTHKNLFLLFIIFFATSCATYAPQYKNKDVTVTFPKDKEVVSQFYLIGDAGYSPMGGLSVGLTAAKSTIEKENSANDYALYLGDNIYPSGMPPKDSEKRKYAENHMDGQLATVKEFKGTTYFIPGNHDWYNNRLEGLTREQEYLIEKSGNPEIFQPTNGCPLKSISVNENIQLLIIDTQWYLEDWNTDPNINKNCDIKTREKFFIEIELEIQKNRNKTILFAMHHPMFTNGTHGGHYGLNKHLFPFQSKIPMPFLASLITQVRTQGGVSVQDRYNELYNKLMNRLGDIAKRHPRLVFASGHEHSLHHIEKEGLIQIQSGSASKESAGALGDGGEFSYGGNGFAVMTVFKDGATWVRYFGSENGTDPKLLFQKEIFPAIKNTAIEALPASFKNEKTVAIYTNDSITELSFFKTVWGAKYEKVYATPVKAKVATLDSLYGGLSVTSELISTNYKTLQLQDARGNTYRMRSLRKNSFKYKELINDKTNIALDGIGDINIIEDLDPSERDISFYTASHPYATLALPTLAKKAGVHHAKSSLYYVPKQQKLGRFNETFGDELYYITLEPNENSVAEGVFNYPDDIETTDDILIRLRKNGWLSVDENNYIRSRLFDMLVGAWDREKDRWSWAEYKNKDSLDVFVPIAKNRGDAFTSFEGNILDVASSIFGKNTQRHIYNDDLIDLKWFNKEGIIFDRALIQESGREDWKTIAQSIKEQITDQVIDEAFSKVPPEVQEETLTVIKEHLKARRNQLVNIADRYYNLLSNLQVIEATDNDDIIEITRLSDKETTVKVYSNDEDGTSKILVDHKFSGLDTQELWIYGLDGNDTFIVKNDTLSNANNNRPIFIRIIGGHGNDIYEIKDGNRVKVYDHKTLKNTVVEKEGANLRMTDIYNHNIYDYRKQIDKTNDVILAIGYNPDDGFRTGLQYSFQKDGFQRNPFSFKHTFNAAYYVETNSFDFNYAGEYANIWGDRNLSYDLYITSPNYIENYFGYGNETTNTESDFDANRVQIQKAKGTVGLVKNSAFGSFFKTQLLFETYKIGSDITLNLPATSTVLLDETSFFTSLEGIYSYRSFDDASNPSQGMMFDFNPGVTTNVQDVSRTFGYLNTRLGFYNRLGKNRKLVLKTDVNAKFNFSNTFEFYQGVTLGGETGLRAYREERFTGKSSLVGNADLRYSFDSFNVGLIPLQIGVYGGADLGRVWIPSGLSEKWHTSYGGGLWINGPGGLNGKFSTFTSSESTRVSFGLGFKF